MSKLLEERNQEAVKKVEEWVGEKFRYVNPQFIAGMFRQADGGCSSCGGYVTEGNLSFYDFDVRVVKCFTCQGGAEDEARRRLEEENQKDDNTELSDYLNK